RESAFGSCKTLRFPNCAVRWQRKSARLMWNCRSKLKLRGNVVFTRADGSVRAFYFPDVPPLRVGRVTPLRADSVKAKRQAEDCPPYQSPLHLISACLAFLSPSPSAPEPFLRYHQQTSSGRDRSHCLLPL